MSNLVTIQGTDVISTSRTDINGNFTALNNEKIETSVLSTDSTFASASDAKIPSQLATKAYVDASVNPTGRSWNEYAVDAVGSDAYGITVSGISAYVAGQTFKFKAGTANTGACTLNVNALGAKTIKKDVSSDLVTGDILANQVVVVTYDGTNFVVNSKLSGTVTSNPSGTINASLLPGLSVTAGSITKDLSSNTTTTIAHGLGATPTLVKLHGVQQSGNISGFAMAVYTASTQQSIHSWGDTGSGTEEESNTGFDFYTNMNTDRWLSGVITVDATNITITWTANATPSSVTANIIWEAYK